MGPAQDRDFILRQGENALHCINFKRREREPNENCASGDIHSRSSFVSFNETQRRGSSWAVCSHEGSGRNSLPHRESGVPPGVVEPLTTAITKGTGSGGKIQGQPQGQRRAGVRTQQAVAIVDQCHAR